VARSSAHVTALQFAPGYLAFTRARATDQGFAAEGSVVEFGDWDPASGALSAALSDFVKRHALSDDTLYYVLPRHEAAARILELPSQDAEEIRGMVHLSAEEIVPFPLNELLTSYTILESLPGGVSRVLAVVVKKSVVESTLDVISSAGLRVEQVLLSTASILTALQTESLPAATAVLHVVPDGFEIAVLREGTLVFSRGLGQTVATGSEVLASESIEDLVAECRASLGSYRRDSADGGAVAEIRLSATGVDPSTLAPALEAATSIPVRLAGDLVSTGSLASALGDRRFHIALLPEAELKRRAAAGMRNTAMRLGIAAAVALAATLGVYFEVVVQRSAYIEELDARAEQLRPIARTLLTKRQQLRMIEDRVDRTLSPLRLVAEVAEIAPQDGMNINRVKFDREDSMVVTGSATDPKLFDTLIDGIRAAGGSTYPQFARARELYRQVRMERGQQVWDFAVTIPFQETE